MTTTFTPAPPGLPPELPEAQALLRAGRFDEAERMFLRILERDPDQIDALNAAGMAAMRRGNHARALELLGRVTFGTGREDTTSWMNLGLARQAAGDPAGSLTAFNESLRFRPDNYSARLSVGALLERAGRPHEALVAYFRAITTAQRHGRWLGKDTTGPAMQAPVEHAMRYVIRGRGELFRALLGPVRERHGGASLQRVEAALAIYLGEATADSPDPRQQPSFLYMPGLPATPYLDAGALDWVGELEAQTAAIRTELEAVLPDAAGRSAVFSNPALAAQNLRNDREPAKWDGYYFWRHGERVEANAARCPVTAAALDALPLARIREHAPEVLFSVFTPGTHLLPHRGVTNTRVVAHLPLIVPPDCVLRVGGEDHEWEEGRVVVFDDTYEHEAWNHSESTRVVLILDLWHPELSLAERDALAALVAGIGDFRKAAEA